MLLTAGGGRTRLESDGAELCLRDPSGARTGEGLGDGRWVAVEGWEYRLGAHETASGSDICL